MISRWIAGAAIVFLLAGDVQADWLLLLHAEAGGKWTNRWEAKVESEVKFRDDMSEFYDSEIMPWVAYQFTPWFKLGGGWRQLYSRKNAPPPGETSTIDRYWLVEQRPLADFIFILRPGTWTVEDRVRVEYRKQEDAEAFFRYRNRLRLRSPWSWTKAQLKPWAAWEAFYEDNPDLPSDERLNRHRFFLGCGATITDTVKSGCYYYVEELLKHDEWETHHEIGFDVSVCF